MRYVVLGRTGIKVSVAGLGCGGHSALGLNKGYDLGHAVSIVRQALDLGITYIDTARVYDTERAVGKAIREVPRDQVVLSTKGKVHSNEGLLFTAVQVLNGLDESLQELGVDYVDVYHLHSLEPPFYTYAINEIVPALLRARDAGKFRFLGIAEQFRVDLRHEVAARALAEDCFDVLLVGYNMLNPSAAKNVFPGSLQQNIGVTAAFAVAEAMSKPHRLRASLQRMVQAGDILESDVDWDSPLDFLVKTHAAANLIEAGYRFAAHQGAVHVVLTGTSQPEHLASNVNAILKPPLPAPVLQQLERLFGKAATVCGF